MSNITIPAVDAPPALIAKIDDRTVPMTVRALKIDVEIVGLVARTTMEITFENPHKQDLEGELMFPLPDGAALSGYGLEVDGQIVDASLVEKQRARVVFEEEVRKGVDPGLLEHVVGNQFRTRVWPMPAGRTRSIKVSYVSALTTRGGDAFYELPLRFEPPQRDVSNEQGRMFAAWNTLFESERPRPSEDFRLRVSVAKSANSPEIWEADEWDEIPGFEDHGDTWVAETSRAVGLPEKVCIGLPNVPETCVAIEQNNGTCYFRIDARHDDQNPPSDVVVERVAVVWDASLSQAKVNKQQEFELIRSLFRRWGSVEVELFVLRNELEQPREFSVVAGEVEHLLEMLAEMPYDGGTHLGALRVDDPSYDAVLLFTDGLSNLDTKLPEVNGVPVHVISSSPTVNKPLLTYLAEQTGGTWIDLTQIPVEEAVEQISTQGLTLLGIDHDENDVSDLFPSGACRLEDGRVGISGRLVSNESEITLRFGRGSHESAQRTIRLRQDEAGSGGLVGRLWAQRKVDRLSLFADRHSDEILALGRQFHIVTPNTSLLVLETLEQHLEHQIPPAPSRRALWEEYHRHADERRAETRRRRDAKLDRVAELWMDRVAWWERKFDPSPPPLTSKEPTEASARFIRASMSIGETSVDSLLEEHAPMMMRSMAMDFDEGSDGIDVLRFESMGDEPRVATAGIAIKPWAPDTPYLKAMKNAGDDEVYDVFLEQRSDYGRSPSYYLDCADQLFRRGKRDLGLRVLTNLAELELDSPALLRILGYKLETEDELELATEVFEQVLAMRPEEPQSYRDLALVLDRSGKYQRAIQLLWQVVTGEWDDRFPEIETIALMELNRVLNRMREAGEDDTCLDDLGIDERFVKLLDLDLRVVLTWDADLTDVDLWVVEPNGEKCFYSHNLTRMGGKMSQDFTQGYGPEEYSLRQGMPGTYVVQANYYGSSQQTLIGPATILATIFTNFGRPSEQRRKITVRVSEVKDIIDVGEVNLG